jgi:hypothetical protein
MNKILSTALISVISLTSYAAQPETGYYRVQNIATKRYVYVRDNKGEVNVGATTADYDAIWLIMGEERTHYDASGIIHLNHRSGYEYDIESQGTSVYNLIKMWPCIYEMTEGVYKIGGTAKGTTKYLSDGESNLDEELSFPRDAGGSSATQRQRWSIVPVAESYFGISPTVDCNGTYYTTFYGDFPFSTKSEGMKLYAITKVGHGMAAVKEVKGTVPAATPLLVECKSKEVESNLITIGGEATDTVSGNRLIGVYFNNTYDEIHWNVVEYDKNTMRVLGTTAEGKPGFVTASDDLKYITANTAYISVPEGSDAEFALVSEDEYDSFSAIEGVYYDAAGAVSVSVNGLELTLTSTASAPVKVSVADIAGRVVSNITVSAAAPATVALPGHGVYVVHSADTTRKLKL